MRFLKYIHPVILLACVLGCNKKLETAVFSELEPSNYLTTDKGLNTVLTSAYGSMQYHSTTGLFFLVTDLCQTGDGTAKGGSLELGFSGYHTNFTWDPNDQFANIVWNKQYKTISFCNIVLDNVDIAERSDKFRNAMIGEAKALRGYSYAKIYSFYGPGPIFTSSSGELHLPRATDEEMRSIIEKDLTEAIALLPSKQTESDRVTKGAAMAVLCKYYLQTKQWQKCADIAQQIIDLNEYHLQPTYKDVFSLQNEGNNEIIWNHPAAPSPLELASNILTLTLPPDYPNLPNQIYAPARVYIYDKFIDQFEDADTRKDMILKQWTNKNGVLVTGYGKDQSLVLKYEPDPNMNGNGDGHDFPEIRYSDILLAKAEAMNELSGVNSESVGLINQVRSRAGASVVNQSDFDQSTLRDFIFKERSLEFYYEGHRREDMLRQGTFISSAQARGIQNAQEFRKLLPIPQREVDVNARMVQNEGY